MPAKSDFKILIPYKKIKKRCKEIAHQINHDYKDEDVIFIGILNGSFMFISELFKHIKIDCQLSFAKVSSYENKESTGLVKQLIGINESLKGKTIIIVEDIIDTGTTLKKIISDIESQNPKQFKIVSLLVKPNKIKFNFPIDHYGFSIKDEFVIGFGLDYNGLYRNSKDILVMEN